MNDEGESLIEEEFNSSASEIAELTKEFEKAEQKELEENKTIDFNLARYLEEEDDEEEKLELSKNLTFKQRCERLKVILTEIYGENFEVNDYGDGLKIILRFPDITISNSHGNTRQIKDLFINIITDEDFSVTDVDGLRTTLFPDEWVCGYRHSHLRNVGSKSYSSATFSDFCLGGSSETTMLIGELSEAASENIFNENLFYSFFLTMKSYASWESLEGVPYFKMTNIKYDTGRSINVDHLFKDMIKDSSKMEIENLEFSFDNNRGIFYVNPEGFKYNDYLISQGCTKDLKINDKVFIKQLIDSCNDYNESDIPGITFKGEEIFMKIDISVLTDIVETDDDLEVDIKYCKEIAGKLSMFLTNVHVLNNKNLLQPEIKNLLSIN